MMWFLLAYNRPRHELVEFRRFTEAEHAAAWEARDALIARHLGDWDVEVVLLGARSEDDIRVTHARYFNEATAAAK